MIRRRIEIWAWQEPDAQLVERSSTPPLFPIFVALTVISCTIAGLTFCLGPGPIEFDASQYWSLAGDMANGDWLQLNNRVDYRTPLYPAVLAVYRSLFGTHALMAVVISQHVLLLATNVLLAFIVWRIGESKAAALVAYGICSFALMRPWFANVICPETLFAFFLIAAFGALSAYHRRPGFISAVGFGLLMGLTILVRPVPKLLWLPLIAAFALQATSWAPVKQPPRIVLRHAAAAALGLLLLMAPWYARNLALFGNPFVARLPAVNKWQVCFQGGSAARLSIPDSAAGRRLLHLLGTRDGDVSERYCAAVISKLQQQGLENDEIDQLVSQACREAIVAQPWEFTWPTVKRFVNFWRCQADGIPFYQATRNPTYAGQTTWQVTTIAAAYQSVLRNSPAHWLRWNELCTALFGLGTLALILHRGTRLIGISLALIFAYFAAVTSIVEIENYKYRVFLEPLMVAAVVTGWMAVRDLRRTSRRVASRRQEQVDTVPYGHPLRPELIPAGYLKETPSAEVVTTPSPVDVLNDAGEQTREFGSHSLTKN